MKRLVVGKISRLMFLTLFIGAFTLAATAQATPIAAVSYLKNWDSLNAEWNYTYSVINQSDAGEYFYDFYLNTAGLVADLNNISAPTNWEYWTDNSNFIEWNSTPLTGSEIAPGNFLEFNFSSDIQLGKLPYEILTADEFGTPLDFPDDIIFGTSTPVPVPEPVSMLLFGAGLIGIAGLKTKKL